VIHDPSVGVRRRHLPFAETAKGRRSINVRVNAWVTYLQVAPLALVFLLFLVVPIATIVVVSFFDYNTTRSSRPSQPELRGAAAVAVTWQTYRQTIQSPPSPGC